MIDADLGDHRTVLTQAATAEVDLVVVQPILLELLRLLDEGDPEAGDFFVRLNEKLSSAGVGSHLEALENHIDNFDFEEAAASLRDLAVVFDITVDPREA